MSHEGNDVRVIDRAELEKFAAQRRLPEAVLVQLRSRAKNELSTAADGTFKVPALKRVSEKSPSAGSVREASAPVATPAAASHPLGRSQSAIVLSSSAPMAASTSAPLPVPRLSITPMDPDPTGSSPVSPKSGAPSKGDKRASNKPAVAPLELGAINPAHRMPFNLESHTQQGADEYHAEENQDRHCYGFDHARRLAWMGISDGHCGSGAADFVALNIVRHVSSCLPKGPPPSVEELIKGITKGVQKTEEAFKKVQDGSGACLLLACLWEETLVIANVGDSRAVIGSYKGGATQGTLLTNDHNAINPVEAKLARFRFLRNQGALKGINDPEAISEEELIRMTKEVMEGDDIIVKGRLFSSECTRTIGDFGVKKACFNVITWEPEFTVCRMTDADATLILGCDGVWKTIDAQRAVEIVQKAMESGDSPAQRLVKHAVEEGSGDDQTCLVLDLIHYRNCLASNTDLATKIFKGLSVFDHNTAQALASSAHRTFSAKLARLHKSGGLGSGQSGHGMFEQQAMKTQAVASSVHRESRGKFDRAAAPAPYAGLSLFEQKPKASAAPRRLAQSSVAIPTEAAVGAQSQLSRSYEDAPPQHHHRASSAGSAASMRIDTTPGAPAAAATAVAAAIVVAPAPPPNAASSVLTRSQSSPQMDPEAPAPAALPAAVAAGTASVVTSKPTLTTPRSNSVRSLSSYVFTASRIEDAHALLTELRAPRVTLLSAQLYTIAPAASPATPVGVAIAHGVHYGLTADSRVWRLSLLVSAAHKSSSAEMFRTAAVNLFAANAALHRLECCVESVDLSECKALDDAGWRREGIVRGALVADSGMRDGALYAVLRTDM